MAVKNGNIQGTNWVNGEVLYAEDLNDTFNRTIGLMPVGGTTAWMKTFGSVSSGTATTNTVDKLEDTGATFITDGVTAGMIVYNSTDDTFGIVSSVDSETSITLAADTQAGSSTTDVFPDGNENYTIYATPKLSDNLVECNGQVLSDADSPYNGATIPDLNGSSGTNRFLRGSTTSGSTGGSETHNHSVTPNSIGQQFNSGAQFTPAAPTGVNTSSTSTLPSYYEVVWVMRVK